MKDADFAVLFANSPILSTYKDKKKHERFVLILLGEFIIKIAVAPSF